MQRVALCRMLAAQPEAILLDEPFAALDSHLRWQLEREVKDTLASFPGVTLLVSHDKGEVYRMSKSVCVLNEGTSEPLMNTAELFERPRTLQAALITGCKNCVPAKVLSPNAVELPQWNATLDFLSTIESGITHAGIRAHDVLPCDEGAQNALLCRIIDAADDVLSRVLTLLPAGGTATIRAELSPEAGARFQVGTESWFCLPKERMMLLRETHEAVQNCDQD
jgi:molybdate transport system ATP-binding protein